MQNFGFTFHLIALSFVKAIYSNIEDSFEQLFIGGYFLQIRAVKSGYIEF